MLLSTLALLAPIAAPLPVDESHVADVEFLLDAFEEKAGQLLKQKGVDWRSVRKDFAKRAKGIETDQQLIDVVAHLIAKLEDGHARFEKVDVDMEGFGDGARYPCGLELYEHGKKWYVKRASGEAEKAGVRAGWEVVKVDGEKAAKWMDAATERLTATRGFSTPAAARWSAGTWAVNGPDGESVRFEFKAGRKKRKVTLQWGEKAGGGRLVGPVVFPGGIETLSRDVGWTTLESGHGYVWVGRVPRDLHEVMDRAIAGLGEGCTGLVLDFRACLGGSYDRDALLGRFVPEGESFGGEESAGPTPFTGDVVVLVDPNTISAGETIVGELKEEGRAYLIGPGPTHGASGSKEVVEAPSGRFSVRFVVRSHKQRFNGGRGVEGVGIAPDEVVEYDPELVAEGVDPCIARAIAVLEEGPPKKAVTYVPPARR